jgi:putative hydrolase
MSKVILVDLHVHTIASGHAFSSVLEVVKAASSKGLEGVGIMDHGPALPGGAHLYYFSNLIALPSEVEGIRLFRGAEANIVDEKGNLDISDDILETLDIVAVAFHPHCGYENGGKERNTEVLLRALEKPYIHLIAHPDNLAYPLEIGPVIEAAKEKKVLIEFNNGSVANNTARKGNIDLNREYAEKFAENEVLVAVNSDAHFASSVGECGEALSVLDEVSFPSELIVNTSLQKVLSFFEEKGR